MRTIVSQVSNGIPPEERYNRQRNRYMSMKYLIDYGDIHDRLVIRPDICKIQRCQEYAADTLQGSEFILI